MVTPRPCRVAVDDNDMDDVERAECCCCIEATERAVDIGDEFRVGDGVALFSVRGERTTRGDSCSVGVSVEVVVVVVVFFFCCPAEWNKSCVREDKSE